MNNTSSHFDLFSMIYFFASSDLLIQGAGVVFVNNRGCVSDGIIADGWSAPRTNEPLLAIDAAKVVMEPLGVVVDDDEDDDETDDAVLPTALVKRNGTSSVKWSNCGKWECSILKGKPDELKEVW